MCARCSIPRCRSPGHRSTDSGKHTVKLLLIEDDEQTSVYLAQGLGELGHSCDRTADGLDGLTGALTHDYDAIVLDRNLPKMDGLTVLAALRAERRDTPVLLLSALGQVDDRPGRRSARSTIGSRALTRAPTITSPSPSRSRN